MEKDLLTPKEVCDLLGVSDRTLRTMLTKGLPRMTLYEGSRKYVIALEDLKRFLSGNRLSYDSIEI